MLMLQLSRQILPQHLDWATCDRARVSRDRAFDGLFFSGVRSTRIYCRPVCPVHPARSENVTFYPTAAAAERAGFRPCLRCRPETAPGSPAWAGTATTVARGMRMIDGGLSRSELGLKSGGGAWRRAAPPAPVIPEPRRSDTERGRIDKAGAESKTLDRSNHTAACRDRLRGRLSQHPPFQRCVSVHL
jgi:hypothetical protein